MVHVPPLYGVILAGGASRRMQVDKAALSYGGRPQLQRAYELVSSRCERTFVSVRGDQRSESTRAAFAQIEDLHPGLGPIAGIIAAFTQHPEVAWLVVACDLPFLSAATLDQLIRQRDPERMASAFRSSYDELPEPLCAIWEPKSFTSLQRWMAAGKQCPRKFLIDGDVALLQQPEAKALDNVNTPDEYRSAASQLQSATRQRAQ